MLRPDWTRDRIVRELQEIGIPCGSGACGEIYLEKAFERLSSRPAQPLPVGRELGETGLMFLVHPTLTDNHIDRTIEALGSVLDVATQPNPSRAAA